MLVDTHSKWLHVQIMDTITSEKTIARLRSIFATRGLPQQIITDNGPTLLVINLRNLQDRMESNTHSQLHTIPHLMD